MRKTMTVFMLIAIFTGTTSVAFSQEGVPANPGKDDDRNEHAPAIPAVTTPSATTATCAPARRVNNPFIAKGIAQGYFLTVEGATEAEVRACADGADVRNRTGWPSIDVPQSKSGIGYVNLPNKAVTLWYGNETGTRKCFRAEYKPGEASLIELKETTCPSTARS